MQCRHRRAATLVAAAVTTMTATAFLAGRQAIPESSFTFAVRGAVVVLCVWRRFDGAASEHHRQCVAELCHQPAWQPSPDGRVGTTDWTELDAQSVERWIEARRLRPSESLNAATLRRRPR
ncbi:hypothetical protein [Actinoplanes sp. NBRC 103695]|uniref:hypothetical protein n=1 Tax=Actinoplanes sp. NBRC 103695 TaxID=3032202 RepID=UPI0024A125E5|nr:hypothetical protein [Actinoplanes sp. NBRC 103695]GLZ02120.1 hypothetical protein Acsp02_93710 [Actinoplanes sp. NBRC 103695]